jgi:hypothetical protein
VDFERYINMLCKQVSLSTEALVGEIGESSIAETFEKKSKTISGFLSWTQKALTFKSGGHLKLQ